MAQIPSFEDGNPSDWPTNFSEFKELETILGCGICFEYMATAMVTKCSHNFCSLCIRRYICYKQQCPICLDAVLESDLRNNRIVDEIIQHFTKSRTKLLTLMRSNPDLDEGRSSSNSTDIKEMGSTPTCGRLNPAKSSSSPDLGSSIAHAKVSELDLEKKQKGKPDVLSSYFFAGRNKSENKTNSSASLALSAQNGDSGCVALDVDNESDVTIDGDPLSNPPAENSNNSDCLWSAKLTNSESDTHQSGYCETKSNQNDSDFGSSDHLGSFSSQSSTNLLGFSSPVSKPLQSAAGLSCTTPSGSSSTLFGSGLLSPSAAAVVCPVCNIDVPSRNINLHLDRCLATEQKKDRPNRQTLKRKPMPKLVYTLLSEKDLRKKLSEVGLPSNGNRQVLIKRHHEFTLLYNAQCDSLHPKSVEEIVSEMTQADALKSRSVVQSTATTNLKLDKTSTAEQVELAQKEYVKKHKSQFNELIKAARRNKEAGSECSNSSTVAEVASTSSDADLASEVPSGAPLNIKANAVSSKGLAISWDPPPEGSQNAVIKGYKIEYKRRKDKVNLSFVVTELTQCFIFTDLEKGTEYVFRVQALTVNGSGPTSAWLMKETLKHDLDGTESSSIDPQIETTSQRNPEMESNLERSVSPTASTSADFQVSRPGRRIRRKLDQSLSGTEAKESASNNSETPSVAIRRSLRCHSNKKKPVSSDSRAPEDKEDAEDSEDVVTNVADDEDDDDYEIMPSYSGRKRKAGNNKKVSRPPKTRKPENVAEEPSDFSPVF